MRSTLPDKLNKIKMFLLTIIDTLYQKAAVPEGSPLLGLQGRFRFSVKSLAVSCNEPIDFGWARFVDATES